MPQNPQRRYPGCAISIPAGLLPESGRLIIVMERIEDWIVFRYVQARSPFYDAHISDIRNAEWRARMQEKRWFVPEVEAQLLRLV